MIECRACSEGKKCVDLRCKPEESLAEFKARQVRCYAAHAVATERLSALVGATGWPTGSARDAFRSKSGGRVGEIEANRNK